MRCKGVVATLVLAGLLVPAAAMGHPERPSFFPDWKKGSVPNVPEEKAPPPLPRLAQRSVQRSASPRRASATYSAPSGARESRIVSTPRSQGKFGCSARGASRS